MPTDPTPKPPVLTLIRHALGMTVSEFAREWRTLDEKDKTDLRKGVADGTLTY